MSENACTPSCAVRPAPAGIYFGRRSFWVLWRSRFLAQRLAGLGDVPRSGKPARYDAGAEQRILRQLEGPPPPGYARWNGALLAAALQDISDDQIWRSAGPAAHWRRSDRRT